MEDKNYKGLIWLVVILIILVVAMMGFIVYKELNDEEKPCNINTTNTTTKEEDKKLIKDVKDFPKKSDESVLLSLPIADLLKDEDGNYLVDINENFEEVHHQINGLKYTISCEEFGEHSTYGSEECLTVNIKFEDYDNDIDCYYGEASPIIITNDYVITQGIGSGGAAGGIYVRDKKDNDVLSESNGVWSFSIYNYDVEVDDPGYSNNYEVKIAVVDNVLYYVSYDEEDIGKLYFNSFDLSNLKKTKIQEFEGSAAGMVD